eukprot:1192947-Prorocentrum_minimum.AAC.5
MLTEGFRAHLQVLEVHEGGLERAQDGGKAHFGREGGGGVVSAHHHLRQVAELEGPQDDLAARVEEAS